MELLNTKLYQLLSISDIQFDIVIICFYLCINFIGGTGEGEVLEY